VPEEATEDGDYCHEAEEDLAELKDDLENPLRLLVNVEFVVLQDGRYLIKPGIVVLFYRIWLLLKF
jgi:hypothetical protein